MKTLDLHHNALHDFPAKVQALRHKLAEKASVQLHLPKVNFHFNAKSTQQIKTYLMDAVKEGLKQNLLGAEIDMEFVVLSIRTYGSVLLNMASQPNPVKQLPMHTESSQAYSNSSNTALFN
ncbi:hypothetical protein [Mucilaginibacter jinjuensis]|uniref:Uncharacterized protein n=1 Tax=Mucilaginibacter jinjuensis TaxID=1176721 RepID=A0ABY7T583_9SPHI|nr:hypothetical protein [Mucilaginibacter jinjuensis]WCT11419.1 hypothetical protein PQO05_22015 [Mucilaginibacter jinjuensis]